jgi:dihydrofolate reductase
MGHPVIMGRKTWQSLDGPLPGRKNIVLGRSIIRGIEGVFVVRTPAEAIVEACDAHGTDKAFVIGGAETYRLFAPLCDEAHVTLINSRIKGDVRFPCDWMCDGWSVEDVKMLAPGVYYSRRVRPEA